MDPAPIQLGPFTLLGKIGEGGMGVVYKARDTRLDRLVAIKLLPDGKLADADRRARFIQEAKAASALNHPNIVTIHEINEDAGRVYIVMELIDGKPLNEMIPRNGIKLLDGLRIGVQAADALAAAHAANIVHRDLKPGNIMVDANGRVKILDFGLAKLAVKPLAATDETLTVGAALTEEGVIVGSAPYMSPEQAEGKQVDARSDIFSFGSVLYEIFSGKRAFATESRVSTLAAVVEKDPPPLGDTVPPELEKLIARCMRKDLAKRSQNISDVKLALEELRDETESGKIAKPTAPRKRALWPIAAAVAVLAGIGGWFALRPRAPQPPATPDLVRVSPDDPFVYREPAISPDGKFVAYVSNRGGRDEIWLQLLAVGEPIQITRSTRPVRWPQFTPDGTKILFWTYSADFRQRFEQTIEIVPALGGTSRVIARGALQMPRVSPDGRHVAVFEAVNGEDILSLLSIDGGSPIRLTSWRRLHGEVVSATYAPVWTPDGKAILNANPEQPGGSGLEVWRIPIDGSAPSATGIYAALRTVGLEEPELKVLAGEQLLAVGKIDGRGASFSLRLDTSTCKPVGAPKRLAVGTEDQVVGNASREGTAVLYSGRRSEDLFLLPIDPQTGDVSGPARRLTADGRVKTAQEVSGDPGLVYFREGGPQGNKLYSLDLQTGAQSFVADTPLGTNAVVSSDGKTVALGNKAGDISIGPAGGRPESLRPLCMKCGTPRLFSPELDSLLVTFAPSAGQKRSLRLVSVATGKSVPWIEDPANSLTAFDFVGGPEWLNVNTVENGLMTRFLVRWRVPAPPKSEWVEIPLSAKRSWSLSIGSPFIYGSFSPEPQGVRFDTKSGRPGKPFPLHFIPGPHPAYQLGDGYGLRGPGFVISRQSTTGSIWTMKLPD